MISQENKLKGWWFELIMFQSSSAFIRLSSEKYKPGLKKKKKNDCIKMQSFP